MKENVFITGTSGCIGHYLIDFLKDDPAYQLHALSRSRSRLKFDPEKIKNITLINEDLHNVENLKDIIKEMDYIVHIAACWGGHIINYENTKKLFEYADPARIKKIIYYSTASILGPGNKPNLITKEIGTPYIRGKYMMHEDIPTLAVKDKITTLFITWLLGGDQHHPYSHASTAIKSSSKWLWLLRFLSVDAKFHYIHARDAAAITAHLLKNDSSKKEYVLGNPAITADQLIDELCRFMHKSRYFKIRINPDFVKKLTSLLRIKLSAWDQYNLDNRNLVYDASNAASFGLSSDVSTLQGIFMDLFTSTKA